jgi:predicted  nucleic acid-binding Zn-ribbon protein
VKALANPGKPFYNPIMSQAFHLAQLQKIDTELDQIQSRITEIDQILSTNELLDKAVEADRLVKLQLKSAQKDIQHTEESIQKHRIKMETSEAALYGGKIRNPKELQDLQNEIRSLKKVISTLEDEQLNFMLISEEIEDQQNTAAKNLVQVEADSTQRVAGFMGEKNQLLRRKERLFTEKEAALPQIPPADLAVYDRLRKQKRGLAVSQVEDGGCKGCGSALRPAEIQLARSPSQLVLCSTCGRILYAG